MPYRALYEKMSHTMKLLDGWRFRLLFWTWFVVAVLFGVAAGADILGNGPQAYLGGLLAGAAYVLAAKLISSGGAFDADESQTPPMTDQPIRPPISRGALDARADQERFVAPKKGRRGSRRGHSRSQQPKSLSLIERLRTFARLFGKRTSLF
jgi:hypothetical protein